MPDDCIFCSIVAGEAPASVVYESDRVLGFMDINPVNLFYADGEAAGQEVFHAHLHLIPRYSDDGFDLTYRTGPPPSRAELDRLASEIR